SDNGSSDGTAEICRAAAAGDARVRYLREESNRGPTWNFNRVLSFAHEAEFYMWAAHDDLWAPDYASSCIRFLREQPDAGLCGTTVNLVDESRQKTVEIDHGCSTLGLSRVERAIR